jgi:hypothetical protein
LQHGGTIKNVLSLSDTRSVTSFASQCISLKLSSQLLLPCRQQEDVNVHGRSTVKMQYQEQKNADLFKEKKRAGFPQLYYRAVLLLAAVSSRG